MRKSAIVAIIFFLLGVVVMYAIQQGQIRAIKSVAAKMADNCFAGLQASNELVQNCSAAYDITSKCVTNFQACDVKNAASQLQGLNNDKIQLQTKLTSVNDNAGQILEEARGVLQK